MASFGLNSWGSEEKTAYREAFEYFDWNKSGTIPNSVNISKYDFFLLLTVNSVVVPKNKDDSMEKAEKEKIFLGSAECHEKSWTESY